jgi:glycosyltransferase involved in cell wall biosynthesis
MSAQHVAKTGRSGETPRISVICIFHDEETYLAEAIESVLAQDFDDYELLLADDGSGDRSSAIAKAYVRRHPGKVFYLEHPEHANLGMSATRNLELRHARGAYVAMIDGDDRWIETKLSAQLAILEANPDVGMVCGGYIDWKSWAGGSDETVLIGPVANRKTFPPDTTLAVYPLGRACGPTNLLITRELVEQTGGYEPTFRGLYEDQVFLAKLFLASGVYWSAEIWLKYRRHPQSCTLRATEADYFAARKQFLDWFTSYIARREIPRRRAVQRAVSIARWQLRHPTAFRVWEGMRPFLVRLAKACGLVPRYRRYRQGI